MNQADAIAIPACLRDLPQWVLWRGGDRIDKKTGEITGLEKVPYTLHLRKASSTNPTTWTTYARAVQALPLALEEWQEESPTTFRGGGIGFVFTADDPYCGIDLDHCVLEDGSLEPWAQEIVTLLGTYTEYSPSGTGVHCIAQATLPGKGVKRGAVELYACERFFTMTGRQLPGTPAEIDPRQVAVETLLAQIMPARPERAPKAPKVPAELPTLDDQALLNKALHAKNAAKFKRLWAGDTHGYPSMSEAVAALCSLLKFWTNDPEQIDRLFRQSGLMSAKWDTASGERTYGERAIGFVLGDASLAVEPPHDVSSEASEEVSVYTPRDIAWREHLILQEKKGTPVECIPNILLLLQHLPEFAGLWWDTFRQAPMHDEHLIDDTGLLTLARQLGALVSMPINRLGNFRQCVSAICHEHERDSLQEYMSTLAPWDGEPRVSMFFATYAGVTHTDYTSWASLTLWCQLAARITTPGCQARFVHVLEGAENSGKSELVAAIGTPWHGTLSRGMDNKEAQMAIQGTLLMELPELSSLSRTEEDQIKAFVTMRTDSFVPKYANSPVHLPRRTLFMGTTNDTDYLKGLSGNTRFIPLKTGLIWPDKCARDRDQLLQEAMTLLDTAWWEETWDTTGTIQAEREARRAVNVYEDALREWLGSIPPGDGLTWAYICERFLQIDNKERWKDVGLQRQIAQAMRGLGYVSKSVRHGNSIQRKYVLL